MLLDGRRLVERATRWLCRARARTEIDVTQTAHHFEAGVRELYDAVPEMLTTSDRQAYETRLDELTEAGVPGELARRVAAMPALLSVFDIVEDAAACGTDQYTASCVYFGIGERLSLDWLRDRVLELPRSDRWQALARSALRDDLYELHRMLTREILQGADGRDGLEAIEWWLEQNADSVARARSVLADVRASEIYDTTTLPVVVRELKNLASEAAPLSCAVEPGRGPPPPRPAGASKLASACPRSPRQSPSCPSRASASRPRCRPTRSSAGCSKLRASSAPSCACRASARARCPRRSSSVASGGTTCSTRRCAARSGAGTWTRSTRPGSFRSESLTSTSGRCPPRASRCASRSRSACGRPPASASTRALRSGAASRRSTSPRSRRRSRRCATGWRAWRRSSGPRNGATTSSSTMSAGSTGSSSREARPATS